MLYTILGIYLAAINLIAYITYAVDKYKATHRRWRIPEATLLCLAALGGGVGAWLAMYTVRHKTKHLKFVLGVPAILLLELGLGVFLWFFYHG